MEQFYAIMQEAFKERRVMASRFQDHEIRKRSHLIVELALIRKGDTLSRFQFCELTGSEQSVAPAETIFVRDTSVR